MKWVTGGMPALPLEPRKMPVTDAHIAYINLYEFKQVRGEQASLLYPSVGDPDDELQLSGIVLR